MKLTLVMATTINGFVAGPEDDTSWVKGLDAFNGTIVDFGVLVMGKRTYDECIREDAFPYKGALNIVMTHDEALLAKKEENALFTSKTPKEIVALASEKGFERLLVIGGGHLNASFLSDGLIDEIILDIHPMILSSGIRLFEGDFPTEQLELLGIKELNDQVVQVRYQVKK